MPAILEKPEAVTVSGKQRKTATQMAAELRAECNTHTEEQRRYYYRLGLEMVRKAGNEHAIVAFRH